MAPTNLVVVCCHGVWTGGPSAGADEAEWLIADFQRGETAIFREHVRAGVRCLAEDRGNSVLVFSGAATRKETELSEAQSYANLAQAHGYWSLLPSPPSSTEVLVEDRALDSYHNVLFSLTLFWGTFRRWPGRVTVVSHAFKKPRIVDGHCAAIGFPREHVAYPTIPGVVDDPASLAGVAAAEEEWTRDEHGRGQSLAGKRARRNPWGAWQGVFPRGVDGIGSGLRTVGGIDAQERLDVDAPRPFT
ncbi:hypothetical protein LMH87_000143 [Akanthomyces muscarius]|uniref:DUF218 domain-containing protein n=1 Tax=Akanthomyces muscarius TaxID=2231603 RepID=A0A9W8QEV5_AKAMU|nr:hypothetical protein LMH87_000143 [Akanthomyces muscarius]KAJ4154869.1 hypothetical protein LMH87_000143 [Akanthomyces muscarius]